MPKRTYADWGELITKSESRMQKRIHEWRDYLSFYRMDISNEELTDLGLAVHVNYQFGIARNILPTVYFKNPDVLVSPRFTSGAALLGPNAQQYVLMKFKAAKARQKLLQYQLEFINFEDEARRCIFDALFCGYSVMKIGYKPQMEKPKDQDPFDEALGELAGMDIDGLLGNTQDEEEEGAYDPNQRVTKQNPLCSPGQSGQLPYGPQRHSPGGSPLVRPFNPTPT